MGKFIDLTGQRFGRWIILFREKKPENLKNNVVYWRCLCDCGNESVITSSSLKSGSSKGCGKCFSGKNLIGQKFHRLLVIERECKPQNSGNYIYWKCECDCGSFVTVRSDTLISGRSKSCGCLHKELSSQYEDLSGNIYGRLTVISFNKKTKKKYYWNCNCTCGNSVIVAGSSLKRGVSKSCGCLQREIMSKSSKKDYKMASFNRLFRQYKTQAKHRGLIFELSKEEFINITEKNCHYCNQIPFNLIKNKYNNGDYVYNGIDRIDSSKGYTINNVVPCCKMCNYSKNDRSQQEFYSWIDRVHSHIHKDD